MNKAKAPESRAERLEHYLTNVMHINLLRLTQYCRRCDWLDSPDAKYCRFCGGKMATDREAKASIRKHLDLALEYVDAEVTK